MFSGLLACPLLPRLMEKTFRVSVKRSALVAAAVVIMAAGRITVALYPPPPPPAKSKIWQYLE